MSKAETELNWLRDDILPKIAANGKLSESGNAAANFQIHDIQIKFIGEDESFMLTTCYRALVNYSISGVKQTRKLVIKKTPNIPQQVYDVVCYDALFSNEIEFYTKILPAIRDFLKPQEFVAPKFYYGERKPGFATIILGDFNEGGWLMSQEQYNLPLDYVLLAASYIGRFHGIGFAMKHKDAAKFAKLVANLAESRFAKDERVIEYELELSASFRRTLLAARKYYPEIDASFLETLEGLNAYSIQYGRRCMRPVEPLCTLCHGDYLRNNVAYSYVKAVGSSPSDIMMFDYQTLRLASPMIDFTVFLSMSTLADTRYANFEQIFNCYHKALEQTFEQLSGSKLPDFLSCSAMLCEYVRFLPYSLSVTSFFLMNIVEPKRMSADELFNRNITHEEIIESSMKRGGEIVDRELAHQVKEMYELSMKYKVNIAQAFAEAS